MYKICIISIYMGEFPNYSNLWFDSCLRNENIDFLLITDQDVIGLPPNVRLLKMNLSDVRIRFEEKLGRSVCLTKPYKCCDLKPIYGFAFDKELEGYDFWGHCDMDVIWGDIRKFVTDDILSKFDKIYTLGHFSLYRNSEKCNKYFMFPGSTRGDYQYVISTSKSCIFDETYGIDKIFEYNNFPIYRHSDCADIDFRRRRMTLVGRINYPLQAFLMENGNCYRVYECNGELHYEEFCYIHLQKRFYINTIKSCNRFFVTIDRFIPFNEEISSCILRKINPFVGDVYESVERLLNDYGFRIKRLVKNIFIK